MRLVWALLMAAGVLLVVGPRPRGRRRVPGWRIDARQAAGSAGAGAFAGLATLLVVGVPMVACIAAVAGGTIPVSARRAAAHRRKPKTRRAAA